MTYLDKLAERLKGVDSIVGHDPVKIREALDFFQQAPDKEDVFFLRAYLRARLEDYGPAKADLDRAIDMALEREGSIPVVYHGLCAIINSGLGRDYDASRENFIVRFAETKAKVKKELGL